MCLAWLSNMTAGTCAISDSYDSFDFCICRHYRRKVWQCADFPNLVSLQLGNCNYNWAFRMGKGENILFEADYQGRFSGAHIF